MAEPPEKKQRTEEPEGEAKAEAESAEPKDVEMKAAEEKEEEKKEPEPPKELEEDAPADKKPRIKDKIIFLVQDTTINVMSATTGNVLMAPSDGGIQHLMAGARANVGLKSGRYMFEAKILEFVSPAEDYASRAPKPKNVLRIGFSTAGSPLIMGEAEGSVCFDSDRGFLHAKKRTPVATRFARDDVLSVLLNLEEKSPNSSTVSLFKNGVRISQPQLLPEALRGQTLYPTVSWKSMTLHVNFGVRPLAPLPFQCRMIQDASKEHTATTAPVAAKDGKYEVVFPVGLPDEGPFDWLDMFQEKTPGYTELSDRMILDWAEKSGIARQQGYRARTSNDRPELSFGVRELDDGSIRRAIMGIAPLQSRNYIIAELRGNLMKEERAEMLARFDGASFRKIAQVVVGEPTSEFKKRTHQLLLKQKQEAADAEFAAKKAEEKRKKVLEKRQKELERARKRAEKVKKRAEMENARKVEEAKKAAEAAKARQEEEAKREKEKEEGKGEEEKKAEEGTDDKKSEETKAEEKKEEGKDEEKEKEPEKEQEEKKADEVMEEEEDDEEDEKEEPEAEEDPPKVELTAEEKKTCFFKGPVPDLTPFALSTALGKLSLPEKAEGFDEIKYEWNKGQKAQEHLKEWTADKKLTTRIEDLAPSDWFSSRWASWQRILQHWHSKHTDYRANVARKESERAAKLSAAKMAEAKRLAEGGKEDGAKEGDEAKEKEPEAAPMDEDEEKEKEVDFDGLDHFGLEDILDVGDGAPLFKEFQFEDWTLMTLRFELHLLAHAFRRDVEDPERTGIHLDHLPFYYQRYYKKPLAAKAFGVETLRELVDLVNDAVYVTKKQVLESQLEAEMESLQVFVKITEEARRHRMLRIALEHPEAKLNIQPQQHFGQFNNGKGGGGGGGKQGGKGHWRSDKGAAKGSYPPAVFPQQKGQYNPPSRTMAPRTVRPPARAYYGKG